MLLGVDKAQNVIIGDDISVACSRTTAGWQTANFNLPTYPTGYTFVGATVYTSSGYIHGVTVKGMPSSGGSMSLSYYNDTVSQNTVYVHVAPIFTRE